MSRPRTSSPRRRASAPGGPEPSAEHPPGPGLSRRVWVVVLILMALLVAADQASKWAAETYLPRPAVGERVAIPGVLSLTYRENPGGPFSLLADTDWSWLLAPLSLVAVGAVLWWLVRAQRVLEAVACAVIVGGAVGNLLDRFRLGAVRDFLNLTFIRWPVFNLADVFISVGVGLLLLTVLVAEARAPAKARPTA